ncbi:AAA family ATPase [ANME-2 cluster archaeon]|nr:MAG: AAA family ATPase [ANME-2 cluster archaeon]
MKNIEFHNREKETKEIRAILDRQPTLITFVYGPINSGKTELINHVIEELPEEYVVFYINLRTKFLASYDDFIESLFEMEMETEAALKKGKETLAELVSSVTKVAGIPITREFLDYVFKDNKPKNAFSYIIKLFEEVKNSGKHPVLILDELQKIGDVKVNGPLIYELFNFFIDLTKEKHLAHVFVATSDSLFIEQIYNEAMLQGRCRYLLVDDFDKDTALNFFDECGFDDREKELAWNYCGGKPVYLVELLRVEDRGKMVERMLKIRTSQISELLNSLRAYGEKIEFRGEFYEIVYDNVIEELSKLKENVNCAYEYITPEITYLVRNNIVFVEPLENTMRAQSRLDLLAIREMLQR